MNLWSSIDLSDTMKSYEYTKNVRYQIYATVQSDDFKNMDSETIFQFVSKKMEIISFGDYLKRFIHQRNIIDRPIEEVSEKEYIRVLKDSFIDNTAPYSFSPIKTRMATIFRQWLNSESVKRNTIFLLGFGLNMSDSEVEEFLTKVNKEESFDFGNPEEAIYWFCFYNHLPYSKARELLDYYDSLEDDGHKNPSLWDAMKHNPKMYVHSEKELRIYLKYLKAFYTIDDTVYQEFMNVYNRVCNLVTELYSYLTKTKDGDTEKVTPYTIERILYAEFPRTGSNLAKMSVSVLAEQFKNKRLSRQHISSLLKRSVKPDRFDLITLLFFLYAHNIYYDNTEEDKVARFRNFMDEVNEILQRCNMATIYLVNPYEAFLLLCLITDDPLDVYYDVWKMSYKTEG